jgi:hypothetical protein
MKLTTFESKISQKFPYVVVINQNEEDVLLTNIKSWCNQTFGKNVHSYVNSFSFKTEQDRTLFLLKWGG